MVNHPGPERSLHPGRPSVASVLSRGGRLSGSFDSLLSVGHGTGPRLPQGNDVGWRYCSSKAWPSPWAGQRAG